MPRPPKESMKITGRVIVDGGSSKEDLIFLRNKLKVMDQSTFIRNAVSLYRRYENGELFKDIFEKSMDQFLLKAVKSLKGIDISDLNDLVNEEATSIDKVDNEVKEDKDKPALTKKEQLIYAKMKRNMDTGWGFGGEE